MQTSNADVSLGTEYGHPHHRVVRREPLFIPAFDDIRKVALGHAEQELRGTYEEFRKVDHHLQRARTWPDKGIQSGITKEMEALQEQRKTLLDRLAELVPKFGITVLSLQLRAIEDELHD